MERDDAARRNVLLMTLVAAVVALFAALALSGCSSGSDEGSAEVEETEAVVQTVSDGVVTIEMPGSWMVEEEDAGEYEDLTLATGSTCTASSEDGCCMVELYAIEDALDGNISVSTWAYVIISLAGIADGSVVDEDSLVETTLDGGAVLQAFDLTCTDEDDVEWEGTLEVFYSGSSISVLTVRCMVDELEEHGDEIDDILASAVVEDPSEPVQTEEETDGDGASSDAETETDVQLSDAGYAITLSGQWYVEENNDDTTGLTQFVANDESLSMGVTFLPGIQLDEDGVSSIDEFEAGFFSGTGVDSDECEETITSDGVVIHRYGYLDDDGNAGYLELVYSGDTCAYILAYGIGGADDETLSALEDILDTLEVADPSAPSLSE